MGKKKKKQFLSFTCDYGSSVFLLSLETITSVSTYGTSGEAPLCKSNKHNDNRDGGRRTKIIRWLETGQYILCAVTIRMLHVDECNSVDLSELAAHVCVCVSLKSDNKSYWIKDASHCCLMSHSCGEKTNVNLQIKVRLGSRYRSTSALRLRANSGGWQSIQSGRLLLPLFY